MRLSSGGDDDVVQIQLGNKPGEPFIITVNCPDKTGLACDICRFILHFGLCILKGGRYLLISPCYNNKNFVSLETKTRGTDSTNPRLTC
jgi:hypothetical protein